MKRCVDEGTLQAYLDGELTSDAARETAAHVAECEACAAALAGAAHETAFFASAFAPDASLSVPTAELRSRVNAAIARLEPAAETNTRESSGWNFGAFVAALSGLFTFTPQRAAALAGVAAVFILFVSVFFIDRPGRDETTYVASGNAPNKVATPTPAPTQETASGGPGSAKSDGGNNSGAGGTRDDNGGNADPKTSRGTNRKSRTPFTPVPAKKLDKKMNEQLQLAPGEREYQTVIANLDKTIKAGEAVLKPKVISDYERNIAVLDRAIEETRRVALQNPKDKDAVNFLRTAYQSKIELMTTVADSAQVATLDRD